MFRAVERARLPCRGFSGERTRYTVLVDVQSRPNKAPQERRARRPPYIACVPFFPKRPFLRKKYLKLTYRLDGSLATLDRTTRCRGELAIRAPIQLVSDLRVLVSHR